MDTQKTLLAVALSIIVLLLFQAWMVRNEPAPTPKPAATTSVAVAPTTSPAAVPAATGVPAPAGPVYSFRTDTYDGAIALDGGNLVRLGLVRYPETTGGTTPVQLLSDSAKDLMVQQSGLVGADGQVLVPVFSGPTLTKEAGADAVTMSGHAGPLQVEKRLQFQPGSYLVRETLRITNTGSSPWSGAYYDQILRNGRTESHWFMYIFTGAVLYHNGSFSKAAFGDLSSHPEDYSGHGWAGMMDHYFLAAVLPPRDQAGRIYARPEGENYAAGISRPIAAIAPGQTVTIEQDLYLGPKVQETLAALGRGLEQTIDYGWFTVLAEPMYQVLSWFHRLTGNWGAAIILLTLAVKILFFYPSAISYRSMANMRKLQPKLERIRKECGDDRQKLSQAMMELYRSEKVNPMSGCLPIFIQMPVFISLYWVLVESVSLRQAPFILWINDLAAPDPFYILPLLMGVSMFVQQRLNPAPVDPMQKRVMMALPVVFTVFFSFFPSGLVLYWLVNNLISLTQQYYITRRTLAAA